MPRGLCRRPLRRGPWSFVTTRTLLLHRGIWPWWWLWHVRLWRWRPSRLGAWHSPMIIGRRRRPILNMLHCQVEKLREAPPWYWLLAGRAAAPPVSAPMARCRSWSAMAGHNHEPFGGVRGSWAAHDLHLQIATGLLVTAALQKLIQLMHMAAGLLEPDAFWLYQDWPGLCLLAHKRTGKRMMTWQTYHSRR